MEQIPQTSFTLSAAQCNFFPLESDNSLDLSGIVFFGNRLNYHRITGKDLKDHSSFGGAGSHKIWEPQIQAGIATFLSTENKNTGVQFRNIWNKLIQMKEKNSAGIISVPHLPNFSHLGHLRELLHLFARSHSTKTPALEGPLERIPRFCSQKNGEKSLTKFFSLTSWRHPNEGLEKNWSSCPFSQLIRNVMGQGALSLTRAHEYLTATWNVHSLPCRAQDL